MVNLISPNTLPNGDVQDPDELTEPSHDEIVRSAYERGVKDGAERADQWASRRFGLADGDAASAWVLQLLETAPTQDA